MRGVCPPEHIVVVVYGMGLDGTAAAGLAITFLLIRSDKELFFQELHNKELHFRDYI